MSWSIPKTDWKISYDTDGNYTGDRFNAVDYNRIKNNISYLRELAINMYNSFNYADDMGSDKEVGAFFYAYEINAIEYNFNTLNICTLNSKQYYTYPRYDSNGKMIDYVELNRLESAILDMYQKLTNELEGRRKFTWNFGMKGDI